MNVQIAAKPASFTERSEWNLCGKDRICMSINKNYFAWLSVIYTLQSWKRAPITSNNLEGILQTTQSFSVKHKFSPTAQISPVLTGPQGRAFWSEITAPEKACGPEALSFCKVREVPGKKTARVGRL